MKKMKLKRVIFAFVILIISAFGFAGCANVEFIRAVDPNNVIIDKLIVEVDESKINKSGVELKSVMDSINDDLISFRLSVEKWKSQFDGYEIIKNVIGDGIHVDVSIIKNKASIAIEFANWQMFGLFYGYTEVEDYEYSKAMEDIGPFIDKILTEEYDNEQFGLFLIKYSIIRNSGIKGEIKDFVFNGTNYYDKYSGVNATSSQITLDKVILGDATWETLGWYSDHIYAYGGLLMDYPLYTRGTKGVFMSDPVNYSRGGAGRVVLIP